MRLVTRGPSGVKRSELNGGGSCGHKPGFGGEKGAEALGSRRPALTLELGREGLALETDCDVDASLLLAAAGMGALDFVHWDLGRGEGHQSDDIHHRPGAAGRKHPSLPWPQLRSPLRPTAPSTESRGIPPLQQTATPVSPQNDNGNSLGSWFSLAVFWPIFHTEE